MGNFHCIPSTCGRVVYREYESAYLDVIESQYKRDRIYGKNLVAKTEQIKRPKQRQNCCVNMYDVEFTYRVTLNGYPDKILTYKKNNFLGDLDLSYGDNGFLLDNSEARGNLNYIYFRSFNCEGLTNNDLFYGTSGGFRYQVTDDINIIKWDFVKTIDYCRYDCKVTVTGIDENQESFEWTKTYSTCPEIEREPCRLSDVIKEIEIEKKAYSQRIEVRNQAIDVIIFGVAAPFVSVSALPKECLNIYKTFVSAPPFLINGTKIPTIVNLYSLVQQICSDPGCPPPEYEVICDCECEQCPDGTCPVECDDHICCYDTSTGVAIKEIPLAEYCEEQN